MIYAFFKGLDNAASFKEATRHILPGFPPMTTRQEYNTFAKAMDVYTPRSLCWPQH